MAITFPTRSSICGGLAGVAAWGIVAVLQSYGLMPIATSAAPAVLNLLQATGFIPVGFVSEGGDPVSALLGLITKMVVTNYLLKKYPSAAELDQMLKTIGKVIPQTYSNNDQLDPKKSDFPSQISHGEK